MGVMMAMLMCLLLLLLNLNLTTALPQVPRAAALVTRRGVVYATSDDPEWDTTIGDLDGAFCFQGWDQRNFVGNWVLACCYNMDCCQFHNWLLNDELFSAKTWLTSTEGVRLWPTTECTAHFDEHGLSDTTWIDSAGWRNLASKPAYYSMSVSPGQKK